MGKVRDILKTKGTSIFSVKPTITVYDTLKLMVEKNIGAVLVCNEQGKFEGDLDPGDHDRKSNYRKAR
jgi:CBS domain-containing protein